MRVLLDTHVWLWMLTAPERVGEALPIVEDPGNELFLSAASSWEIAIKHAAGRLPLPEAPAVYVPDRMRSTGVTGLAVEHRHALEVSRLPDHHRDPVDRLLIAQSLLEGLPIITTDDAFADYDVELLPVG